MDDLALPPDHANLEYVRAEDCGFPITDGLMLESLIVGLKTKLGKDVHAVGIFEGGIVDLEMLSPTGLRGVKFCATDGKWKSEYISVYNRDLEFAISKS
jgi:hypothetical protein